MLTHVCFLNFYEAETHVAWNTGSKKNNIKELKCINLNTLNNTPFNCPDYKCVQYASVYLSFKIQIYVSKIIACIISTHFIHMTNLKIILWSITSFDRYKRAAKNKTVVCFSGKKGIIMVKITFFKEIQRIILKNFGKMLWWCFLLQFLVPFRCLFICL